MISAIYNKAFSVELSHDFFETENKFNINRDIEITPAGGCATTLRNGRMRFIRNPKGASVFYESYLDSIPTPTEKPLVKLPNGTAFLFSLQLKKDSTPFLLNVSDLNQGGTYSSGKIFMLDATATGTTPATIPFTASLIDQLRPSAFTYTFRPTTTGLTANLTVKVYPEGSVTPIITINNVPVDPVTGIYSVGIDLNNQPNGIYTIEAKDGANLENSASIYVDTELSKQDIFGLVRIKYPTADRLYDSCGNKTDFFTFEYAFDVRSTTWRYYIIPQNVDTALFDLAVKDDQLVPVYTFNAVDPSTQPWGTPTSLLSINGLFPVIMESTVPIPFSETALNTITLFKRATGGSGNGTAILPGLSNALNYGVDSDRLGAAQLIPVINNDISEIFVIA